MRLGMGLGLGNLLSGGPITGMSNKYSFNFDGSNQTLNLSDAGFPSGNSAFTISCWFNKTSSVSWAGLVSWGTASNNQANFLNFDDASHVKAGFYNNDLANGSGTATSTGVWYNAVVTYDGTTRRIYVNGSEEVSDTPSSVNVTLGGTLRIGTTVDGNYDFNGLIDEVGIWNTALSASDVAKIASKPSNLSKASSYDTDRTSNLKLWLRAGDKVLPEEDASIARSDFYTDFDGVDDHIALGSITSSNPLSLNGSHGSVIFWVNIPDVSAGDDHKRIIDKSDGGSASKGYSITVRTDGSINGYMAGGNTITSDAGEITDAEWFHIVWKWDGTNHKLYKNGIEIKSASSSTTPPSDTADMAIGS